MQPLPQYIARPTNQNAVPLYLQGWFWNWANIKIEILFLLFLYFFDIFILFWLDLFTVLTNHQPSSLDQSGEGYHGFFRWSFSCQLQLIFIVVLSNPRDMIVQGIFLLTPIALPACSFTFLHIVYFIHFPSTALRWFIEATLTGQYSLSEQFYTGLQKQWNMHQLLLSHT